MNQEYPTTPPMSPTPPLTPPVPPSSSKEWGGKETLSVVFLVLLPIVGLILMWVIANWSKKVKIIITAALLLPVIVISAILGSIVLGSLGEAKESARDAVRRADMRIIVTAQQMYWGMNDQYYQSANYPISIPDFITETPTDPKTEGPYGWIDNTRNNQKFCAYVDLEKNGFYVATHKGNGEIEMEPRSFSDCEKFSRF